MGFLNGLPFSELKLPGSNKIKVKYKTQKMKNTSLRFIRMIV